MPAVPSAGQSSPSDPDSSGRKGTRLQPKPADIVEKVVSPKQTNRRLGSLWQQGRDHLNGIAQPLEGNASKDQLFATSRFDGASHSNIVERVHRGTIDDLDARQRLYEYIAASVLGATSERLPSKPSSQPAACRPRFVR
jgi:hypothetical protein